jgi:hypothetical protein
MKPSIALKVNFINKGYRAVEHYKIHWKLGHQTGKTIIGAETKVSAIQAFETYARMDLGNPYSIPFEAEIVKTIKVSNIPSTSKQRLAQRYGFIMGGVKGAHVQFRSVRMILPNGLDANKVNRAVGLVDMQFAKLERDIRDFFKLAGLKIK